MLKQMNWEENQGLGAKNQGTLNPIKTRLKNDKKGLGNVSKENLLRVTHFKPGEIPNSHLAKKKKQKIRITKAQKHLNANQEKKRDESIRASIFRDEHLEFFQ